MGKGTERVLQGTGSEPIREIERDTLVLRERAKYEAVWADPRYRLHSPGERLAQQAFETMGMQESETLIDYGCGCGRPMVVFKSLGLDVTGVDIAKNCLDDRLEIPFRLACLWNLPEMTSDWAFCTDVMEHIPEEKVDDVLRSIAERTDKGAFFQIATRLDSAGMMIIGEQLHLTVKGSDWWKHKLKKFWIDVDLEEFSTWVVARCR